MTCSRLVVRWREQAAQARMVHDERGALLLEDVADQLEHALRAEEDELLTLPQAEKESGYSAGHLSRMVRDGKIANAGRYGAPRLRRGDLPIKRSHLRTSGADEQFPEVSPRQIAQSIVTLS